jgi:phosphatidylserine decarboxylase
MIKIAPEGWPFIVGAVLLTLAVYLFFRNWSVAVPVVLVLFMLFFFRDPERVISGDKDIFVSPADGKVIVIKDVFEDRYLKADARQISIFMSPFNVHVNRSPVDGTVTDVIHTRGDFKAAYKDSASASNENTVMILDSSYGKIVVRQVAGFIARRIVCRVKPGDKLVTGQRYGIIKFSSRVDIFLPKGVKTAVSLGDSVKAGETIIARIKQ